MTGVLDQPVRPAWRGRAATVGAVALLVVVPLIPGALATGSVPGLVRLPVESILILLILALIPPARPSASPRSPVGNARFPGHYAAIYDGRTVAQGPSLRSPAARAAGRRERPAARAVVRVVLAAGFGAFVGIAVLLAAIDRGYEAALGIHFVPLDWMQLADAYGVVASAIGSAPASALFTAAAALIVALSAGLAWAALRVDAALRRQGERGRRTVAVAAVAWIAIAAVATPLGVAQPVAAAASTDSIESAFSRTVSALQTRAAVARQVADDPFAAAAPTELLTALQGKDVVFVFIESYGRVAIEGAGLSRGVAEVLAQGEDALAADGFRAQSAWLTSPTFGGVSWLAHATLQSGVWVDSQAVYDLVVHTDRLTLSGAFGRAGWRTVSDVPSNRRPGASARRSIATRPCWIPPTSGIGAPRSATPASPTSTRSSTSPSTSSRPMTHAR